MVGMKEILAAIGLVVALPALIMMWMTEDSPEQVAAKERQDFEGNARVVCSMKIEESLRNPDSVDWNDRFAWPIIEDGENLHTVIAKYRAENGFGGMVNETRQCLVMRRDDRAMVLGIE